MNKCKKCNEPINGNYCSNCGHPAKLKRYDKHYISQEIANAFSVEKGMLYTIKKLLTSPGKSIRLYITEDRSRYAKPISFLIITSLIYALTCNFFHIAARDFSLQQPEIEFTTTDLFINWLIDYNGYVSIISGFFVAFCVKLFFRKSGYNLVEIFVLLCYLSGISTIFGSVIVILQGLTQLNLIYNLSIFIMIYYAWAIGQFFDEKKAISYIKAFLSSILGFFIFGFLVLFIAIFIDIVI